MREYDVGDGCRRVFRHEGVGVGLAVIVTGDACTRVTACGRSRSSVVGYDGRRGGVRRRLRHEDAGTVGCGCSGWREHGLVTATAGLSSVTKVRVGIGYGCAGRRVNEGCHRRADAR
ncbi:Os05g0314150 [Oryza sativa Japonica Group]|uniref:Os05g0314150 protein n=1 Tax=Oryza sativa subsp. japonica TaxID=39947 RepID=A0A0P0WKL0_ORYSJ|nr:Os05g0314150 [Oryza sativa Japonica Group]